MMAFFNAKRRSKLIMVSMLVITLLAAYSVPMTVYADDGSGGSRNPPVTGDASMTDSAFELTDDSDKRESSAPINDSDPGEPLEPELTSYVVEYETATGEKLLEDKVVEDQQVGDDVIEDAEEIEGYSVDESSKSFTLEEEGITITFIYTQVETEGEEIQPAEEEELSPVEEEELPPVEEELPPVVETPEAEEEAVTEPAIIVEPTAVTLKITHRLTVGDQYLDDVRTVEGLEVGQVIDLEPYILTEDWFEISSDVNNITLNEEQTSIILEYKPVEGFVVVVPGEIPDDISDM